MRRVEELNLHSLKIIQDDDLYCFTSDAIILSKFAVCKKGEVVADFCSGSGIVGFNLFGLNENLIKSVTFFELQKPLFEMSLDSVKLNNLEDKFRAVNIPLQDIPCEYNEKFSLIVCNPPYMPISSGATNKNNQIAICKSEVCLSLSELVKAFSKCLKFGGRVCMCHRADRLSDVIYEFKINNIEPKKIQFVTSKNKEPYLLLIEGVKGGKSGVKVLNALEN